MNYIKIRGAREHNLKNISVNIPKNKLVVFTGVSGSGKSSLAFDTIFAEGQRRYVESLSSYARQFLGVMQKPNVDQIEGLSPAISINQKAISHNPRSTVGTTTEIYDYLRLLFARVGHPHCPECQREISSMSKEQIVTSMLSELKRKNPKGKGRGVRVLVLAPLVKDRKGEYNVLFDDLVRRGYTRVRVDNRIYDLDEDELTLIKTNRHTIEVVVDRIVLPSKDSQNGSSQEASVQRLSEAVENALKLSNGEVIASEVLDHAFDFPEQPNQMRDHLYSESFACPNCNISLPKLEPRSFSFNSPHGACPTCDGIGVKLEVDPRRVFNQNLTIAEGGIFPWARYIEWDSYPRRFLKALAHKHGFNFDTPIKNLSTQAKEEILLQGLIPYLERRYSQAESPEARRKIERYMIQRKCPACQGTRLKPESLAVTISRRNIAQICALDIASALQFVKTLKLSSPQEQQIAQPILGELRTRLKFLHDVGLSYLSLDRRSDTLSGGEAQRIRLASQIGSGLSGVLYVLDEPSIGLHARDNHRLLATLKNLRDLDNSVIVVEHDLPTMQQADYILDFGPGAGKAGGNIVAQGTPSQIAKNKASLTGQYLSGKKKIPRSFKGPKMPKPPKSPKKRQKQTSFGKTLTLIGASEHNLKKINVTFPLGRFICVTGVSGSGKSTLIMETLFPRLATELYNLKVVPGRHRGVEGLEYIDKVVEIDQSPIGRTPRSNPATYTGVFTPIRELFAKVAESQARGYKKGRFSFNVKGGRCENCRGDGQIKIAMQFLPDVYINCEVCQGKRYNRETLEIRYRGKNIADVLKLTINEAAQFFQHHPTIFRILQTLIQVGLGYLELGQPAPTLSGGEAQRIKLAAELAKKSTGRTLYLLDEPTTGLHFADIEKLLAVLHHLVAQGNTVIVIEHNLDVIKTADWIIDLGPEGGAAGGRIVAQGKVDDIIKNKNSYTGQYLHKHLKNEQRQTNHVKA